jgi:hypothetical protein
MKKLLLLALSIGSINVLSSQTIVSTSQENKNVVLEEFTGIYCTFCPDGHKRANQLKESNQGDVVLLNIHEGSFAAPNGNDPDFRTSYGSALVGQSDLTGYPAGTINRRNFSAQGWSQDGGTAMSRGDWNDAASVILGESSPVNIAAEATIDYQTRDYNILVEIYYTGSPANTTNKLNVAVLQNNIKGPQTGASSFYPEMIDENGEYTHNHMFRDFITGQWGEDINSNNGPFISKTYTGTIPAQYGSIDAFLGDLEIVAYIAEGQQEILTGDYADITFLNLPYQYDAEIVSVNKSTNTNECGDEITGVTVEVANLGNQDIQSLDFDFTANGQNAGSYNWTGSINTLGREVISLPGISYSAELQNDLEVEISQINGNNDENTSNNQGTVSFENPEGVQQLAVLINTDRYASEVSWSITDENGNVVMEVAEGTYPDLNGNTSNLNTDTLSYSSNRCLKFEINDSYGDGMAWQVSDAYAAIVDQNGDTVIYIPGNSYSTSASEYFKQLDVPSGIESNKSINSVNLYPNPTNGNARLSIVASESDEFNVTVYDVTGKQVMNMPRVSVQQGNNLVQLQTADLNSGMYYVSITSNDGARTVKPLVIE